MPYELDKAFFSTNTSDKLIELVKEMDTPDAHRANKALAYYDGRQEEELTKFLSKHRKNWMRDHVIPRTRNITKMVVDKSGQIIYKTPPMPEVFAFSEADLADEALTEQLQEMLNKSDATETFINLDAVVRLLKTAVILVQWDEERECFTYDILHRGNSLVKWDYVTKLPHTLLYKLYSGEDYCAYRLYLKDWIVDFNYKEEGGGTIEIVYEDDNLAGVVPAAKFDDIQAPRVGFWNVTPMDLVSMNEVYNLHVTESEYAISWMKKPTLFTNARLDDAHVAEESSYGPEGEVGYTQYPFDKLPSQVYQGGADIKFGPSEAVQLDTTGVDNPIVEFMAPEVNIKPIDEVVEGWIQSFASDWSVSLDFAGQGRANSGFQLVVEEMPNQELREKRQKMFGIGMTRLFDVMKRVGNAYGNATFPEDAKLYVNFDAPSLPVESKQEEEIWTHRIENGRATIVDYLMATQGLSQEEAVAKVAEIIEFNATLLKMKQELGMVPSFEPTDNEDEDDEDGEEVQEEA